MTFFCFTPFKPDEESNSSGNSSETDSECSSQTSTPPRTNRQERNGTDDQVHQGGSQEAENINGLQNDILSRLQFISFADHLEWTPTIITPIEGEKNEMIRNTEAMWKHSEAIDERQSFLQYLEIGKQIEVYSQRVGINTYDAIFDFCQDGVGLSIQYLRAILRFTWSIYRYPILELVKMPWKVGMKQIPKINASLDSIIENNGRFPTNITAAQADLHSLCVRVFLQFPERSLGDGDGLPYTTVLSVRGILQNDAPIENTRQDSYKSTSWYRRIEAAVGTEARCRLIGYDTQESPRPGDERAMDIPQPYWQEGRTFLVEQLNGLRGDVPLENAVLLVDCFSVDLYDRLLIDIRGVYHSSQTADPNVQPSLRRFEVANRALSSGYAFPTHNFLVNQDLLDAFDEARQQQRGIFANAGPVYHPSVCRRNRYLILKNRNRSRRRTRPYDE